MSAQPAAPDAGPQPPSGSQVPDAGSQAPDSTTEQPVIAPPSVTSPSEDAARNALIQARALRAAGRYEAAIDRYRAAHALVSDPEVLFELAETYRVSGDTDSALRAYDAYLKDRPQGPDANAARAWSARIRNLPPKLVYPLELVDRPLLMFAGMTYIDLGFNFPTYVTTTTDATGATTTMRTRLGEHFYPDLSFAHSFGVVEVFAGTGITSYVGGDVRIGDLPARVSAAFSLLDLGVGVHYDLGQRVSVAYKWIAVPHRFEIYAGTSFLLREVSEDRPMEMPSSGTMAVLDPDIAPTLQITRRLAISENIDVAIPVANTSNVSLKVKGNALTQLTFALRHWDFYGQVGVWDFTDTHLLFVAFGAVFRFGLP